MLSVAQDEADRDGERIRAVFENKKLNKEPVTGMVPTGYIIRDKKMIKDPDLEEAVNTYFRCYLTLRSVSKSVEEVKEKHGVYFSYQMADAMLRKTAYCGIFNGVQDMCPAYISMQEHESIVSNRRKKQERRPGGERVYLFTGILFYGECGLRLGGRSHRYPRKGDSWGERMSYNRAGRYKQLLCTNRVNISEKDIESFLLNNIDDALDNLQALSKSTPSLISANTTDEKARTKKKLSRLKDLYLNDMIDMDLYRKDYEELTAKMEQIEAEEKAVKEVPNAEKLSEVFKKGWQEMYLKISKKEKQSFWRMTIDNVTVYPDRSISFAFLP
jgi:site-specific DNA recombinase